MTPPPLIAMKRVALCLVSGIAFVGVGVAAFQALMEVPGSGVGSATESQGDRPRPASRPVGPITRAGASDRAASEPSSPPGRIATAGPRGKARVDRTGRDPRRGSRSGSGPGDEDGALLAMVERMERRVSTGLARARESVVALEYSSAGEPPGTRRLATGVVINPDGEVLTVRVDLDLDPTRPSSAPPPIASTPGATQPNPPVSPPSRAPVTEPRAWESILARDASGRRHVARWVAADPESGLTLLRIAPRVVPPIRVSHEAPALGGQVFVVGNPFGLGHSVSRGHIAGLDRRLELTSGQLGGLIQVQAPLYPGDSGALVADMRGQWLGLIRSGLARPAADRPERGNDFGFAVPARDALWIAGQLLANGRVDRAYLGVHLEPTSDSSAPVSEPASDEPGSPDIHDGARLVEVLADSPAALAGLRAGDAIVALDSGPIRSTDDLTDRLSRMPAHATVSLGIVRVDDGSPEARGRRLDITIRLGSRPGNSLLNATMTATTHAVGSPPLIAVTPTSAQVQPKPHGPANHPGLNPDPRRAGPGLTVIAPDRTRSSSARPPVP